LAMPSPIPEVEPVMTADFPLSMMSVLRLRARGGALADMLHRNIIFRRPVYEPYQNTVPGAAPAFDQVTRAR
jgi:hypothetical protein